MSDERESIDLVRHEAAHAVVARLLGGEVRTVTIEAEHDGHAGHTEVAWTSGPPEERLACSARVALAGPLMEIVLRGGGAGLEALEDPDLVEQLRAEQYVWASDWQEVIAALEQLEPHLERREALFERWMREVCSYLVDPVVEEHILRVADALDAHGTLDDTLFEDCFE